MRLLRGVGALLALLLGFVGIPAALILLGGDPLPSRLSWRAVTSALLEPDDGTVVIRLIAVVAWVAWLVFALSLLTELVNLVSGYRLQLHLPGLGGPQRMVAGLLLAVIALAGAPASAVMASPVAITPQANGVAAVSHTAQSPSPPASEQYLARAEAHRFPRAAEPRSASPTATTVAPPTTKDVTAPTPGASAGVPRTMHLVVRGDDLWSLAAHYYGHGQEWRRIARANPHLLTGGPDRLQVGWRLVIPDVAPGADGSHSPIAGRSVIVRAGDTLSAIAEREYGSSGRWQVLYEANRSQLDEPDEIRTGMQLLVPAPEGKGSRAEDTPAKEGNSRRQSPELRAHHRATADQGGPDQPERAETPGNPEPRGRAVPPQGATPQPLPRAQPAHPTESAVPEPEEPGPASSGVEPEADQTRPVDFHNGGVALGLLSVGGLLAAALLGGLSWRRRLQLQSRPVGRRIAQPPVRAQKVETALGHRQRPLDLTALDVAIRSVGAHCRQTGAILPSLTLARVAADRIELVMADHSSDAPVGFQVDGRSWTLGQGDAGYLSSVPGVGEALRPYPTLVSVGSDDGGHQVLIDLEAVGLLTVSAAEPQVTEAVVTAMAVELAFAPWVDELALTLVDSSPGLPEALQRHNVTRTDRVDELLDRLEQRARVQQTHHQQGSVARSRLDPDLADPWTPEIVLVNQLLTGEQDRRLVAVMTQQPRAAMAAVVSTSSWAAGDVPAERPGWRLVLDESPSPGPGESRSAVLHPLGLRLRPQRLDTPTAEAVVDLVAATGTDETTAAPWWDHGGDPPTSAADNVSCLGGRTDGRGGAEGSDGVEPSGGPGEPGSPHSSGRSAGTEDSGEWATAGQTGSDRGAHQEGTDTAHQEGTDRVVQEREEGGALTGHPILHLLGPVELVGAAGPVPPRAAKQCLEYCGWLLEHPGTTAQAMASALVVAEGTRRSNMSRLRTWLGDDGDGTPFLPDAYSGRIVLHPAVSSDWQRLQILTAAGVNKTSTAGLRAALQLVRGAPLADAAPGQWHWAEELRTDMVSVVRDIGVELTNRALLDQDLDLARWSAARALAAAPGDELLLALRIRTEHQAGNHGETERLTLQLAAQARLLGVDLEEETVTLLQEVMEGRVRARMA